MGITTNDDKLTLPKLPGRYRWQKTESGFRIFEDCRHRKTGSKRVNCGHFTTSVLRHVILNEPLAEKWKAKAQLLKDLFARLGVNLETQGL